MTRERPATGRNLHEAQLSIERAGLEDSERIRGDLGAVTVGVIDIEDGAIAVGDGDESVVRGDGDLGGFSADGRRAVAVGADVLDLGEADAGAAVVDAVGRDAVGELVDHEEVGRWALAVGGRLGGPEDGVAGAVGGLCEDGVLGLQEVRLCVDAVDTDDVGAQVGEDHKAACGVEDGLMGVRAVFLLRTGAKGHAKEGEVLEGGEGGAVLADGECGDGTVTIVSQGDGSTAVVELRRHGAFDGGELGDVFERAVGGDLECVERGVGVVPALVHAVHLVAALSGVEPGGLVTADSALRDELEGVPLVEQLANHAVVLTRSAVAGCIEPDRGSRAREGCENRITHFN